MLLKGNILDPAAKHRTSFKNSGDMNERQNGMECYPLLHLLEREIFVIRTSMTLSNKSVTT